jgi:hypothetical protein
MVISVTAIRRRGSRLVAIFMDNIVQREAMAKEGRNPGAKPE